MKQLIKTIGGIFGIFSLLSSNCVLAQKTTTSYTVTQQDQRLYIGLDYQFENDHVLGVFTQDYRITVQNKTEDKLRVYIEYYAETVCGKRRNNQFAPLGDGYVLEARESVVPTWTHKDFGYQRFTQDECPKNTWRQTGTNKTGDKTYSIISSLGYRIVKIINLSEEERKKAEAKKLKEVEVKKEIEVKKQREATLTKQQSSAHQTTNDAYWADSSSSKKEQSTTTTQQNKQQLYEKDENFIADTKFKNNLDGIAEGEYFSDESGGYYRKELGGARKVDKAIYERESANKIYKKIERQEAERQQREVQFKQDWDRLSTSFYSMSAAKTGLQDASSLGGDFDTVEQLNVVFAQKMREISAMSNQMQVSATQTSQAYTSLLSSSFSGYDYSAYTDAIGSIAAAISAGNAESNARAELQRQRKEEEARITARQLEVLTGIRTEISKAFTEGGMPLSSHKITAPVLYVFAYGSNKADWNKNQNIPMTISNVIPVYRYSDGTYPYTSNVKRTFESSGISNSVLMGYFTNQTEAENYRKSLIEVAPTAKFTVKEVDLKVKEQQTNTNDSDNPTTDFWGEKTDTKQNKTKKTETDFWGNSTSSKTK